MTRKEVLEIIAEVANEANEYSPCWNVQKAARELLQMEDPEATQARIVELEQDKSRLDRLEGHIKSAGTNSVTTIRASDAESFNLRLLIDGMRDRLAKDENNGTNTGK